MTQRNKGTRGPSITSANPQVDAFFLKAQTWAKELAKLREIILAAPLTETLKWSKPCYALEGSNVVIIIPLKESCALMFCKGALLKDAKGILTKPGENTQSGRWIKFTSAQEISRNASVLKAYIQEAIAAEKAGLRVKLKQTSDYKVPAELAAALAKTPSLKKAFAALTPGRQRGYFLHISAAKQSKTREARIEKCRPSILAGKGFNER